MLCWLPITERRDSSTAFGIPELPEVNSTSAGSSPSVSGAGMASPAGASNAARRSASGLHRRVDRHRRVGQYVPWCENVDGVVDLGRTPPPVGQHRDGAGQPRGPQRDDPLRAVVAEQHDAVADPDAQRCQHRSGGFDGIAKRAERDSAFAVHQERAIGPRRRRRQQVVERSTVPGRRPGRHARRMNSGGPLNSRRDPASVTAPEPERPPRAARSRNPGRRRTLGAPLQNPVRSARLP